jgi:hypothetical protein
VLSVWTKDGLNVIRHFLKDEIESHQEESYTTMAFLARFACFICPESCAKQYIKLFREQKLISDDDERNLLIDLEMKQIHQDPKEDFFLNSILHVTNTFKNGKKKRGKKKREAKFEQKETQNDGTCKPQFFFLRLNIQS